jgi:hypothetical protein
MVLFSTNFILVNKISGNLNLHQHRVIMLFDFDVTNYDRIKGRHFQTHISTANLKEIRFILPPAFLVLSVQ